MLFYNFYKYHKKRKTGNKLHDVCNNFVCVTIVNATTHIRLLINNKMILVIEIVSVLYLSLNCFRKNNKKIKINERTSYINKS